MAFVPGHPRPKGSLTPQMVRDGGGRLTGRVRMVESSPDSSRWRRIVARHVAALGWPKLWTPCEVSLVFWFDPPSAVQSETEWPTTKTIGDIDKLVRNVLDALTDAKAYNDDRQVVRVHADKRWAREGRTVAGVGVRLTEL